MKASKKLTTKPLTGEQQLKGFIARFDPKHQTLIRSVRKAMRKRFPSTNELVYDYTRSIVIGYSPTERGSDAIVAISSGADGLRLVFNHGPQLPDPKKILLGSGKQTRFIRVESPRTLIRPEVEALIRGAIHRATIPLRRGGRGKLVIKSSSAKQRREKRASSKR